MQLDIHANVLELNIAQCKGVRGRNKAANFTPQGVGGRSEEMIILSNIRINCKSGKLMKGESIEYMEMSNLISSVAKKTQECGLDGKG